MSDKERLMERAISSKRLRPDGIYTIPRSFGLYKLRGRGNVGKKYRIGNHPVRELELIRDYGQCDVVALFLDRDDAVALARHLNT